MTEPVSGQVWQDAQAAELRYWEERKRWCETATQTLQYLVYLADAFELTGSILETIPAASCLEVGVGPFGIGSLVFHARTDAQIVGFDPLAKIAISCPDPGLNAYVQSLIGRVRYEQMRGEDMPFKDGQFDVVASHNVIDHCADPAGVIREIGRVLKPGGVLLLNLYTFSRLGRIKFELNRRLRPNLDLFVEHPWSYTPDSIVALVRSLGFTLEKSAGKQSDWLGSSEYTKLVFRKLATKS